MSMLARRKLRETALAVVQAITGITVAVDKGQHLVPLARDIMFVAEQLGPGAAGATP